MAGRLFSAMDHRWRTVEEVAAHLGVSRDTVLAWIVERGMPAYKVAKAYKFQMAHVDAWVREGNRPGRAFRTPPGWNSPRPWQTVCGERTGAGPA